MYGNIFCTENGSKGDVSNTAMKTFIPAVFTTFIAIIMLVHTSEYIYLKDVYHVQSVYIFLFLWFIFNENKYLYVILSYTNDTLCLPPQFFFRSIWCSCKRCRNTDEIFKHYSVSVMALKGTHAKFRLNPWNTFKIEQ